MKKFIYLLFVFTLSVFAQKKDTIKEVKNLNKVSDTTKTTISNIESSLESAKDVVSDVTDNITDVAESVIDVKKNVEGAKEAVKDVHKNVGDTLSNATEIVSFTKIFTIAVVLLLTLGFTKLLNWFFKNLVKNFNRHRLKILRIQPVINILTWTLAVYTLIVTLFNPSKDSIYALMGGDRINIKGNYGEVVNIGLRNTQVNTLDDNLVTIPNSAIISDNISNANSGALDCMVVVTLWLPVNVNVTKVRKIANEAAITSRYLNIDKQVTILFFDHFDNQPASKVVVKAYVLDARYEKLFEADVTEAAKKSFIEAGIY